jgi:hypothetical protein
MNLVLLLQQLSHLEAGQCIKYPYQDLRKAAEQGLAAMDRPARRTDVTELIENAERLIDDLSHTWDLMLDAVTFQNVAPCPISKTGYIIASDDDKGPTTTQPRQAYLDA